MHDSPPPSRPRRLLRLAPIVGVWLLLGAAVNVGVAWSGKWMYQRFLAEAARHLLGGFGLSGWPTPLAGAEARQWPVRVPEDWPRVPTRASRDRGALWTESVGSFEPSPHGASETGSVAAFGWPLRALCERSWYRNRGEGRRWEVTHSVALQTPWMQKRLGVATLPVVPLWPGFAVNTLFYAALAWGLWQVPIALRHRRRRRRGLCTYCAYDRTGIAAAAPCPECGRAP